MSKKGSVSARRLTELGGRNATALQTEDLRVLIDDQGGMVSELSSRYEKGYLNAHWLPWFRGNSDGDFDPAKHESFWKAKLLYHLAGNFPCVPNFGPDHTADGVFLPPHGWSANGEWKFQALYTDEERASAYALSTMESPESKMPLVFRKIDAIQAGDPVHYTSMEVQNRGNAPMEINIAWHNTVGAPFLEAGCRISGAADRWTTPPAGGEFDTTTRLAQGADFKTLQRTPLRNGGSVDISVVPGMIGYTDMAVGAVPAQAETGWSAVVNPALKMAYICLFPGPHGRSENEIGLTFNALWMQYGGRPFTPWAPFEGGSDLTYCLGTENSVGAYAYGLAYAREHRKILDAPTTVTIPPQSSRILRYGTLFAPYGGSTLDSGVSQIAVEERKIVCEGTGGKEIFNADANFHLLKDLEKRIG